jgi:hypothetical protein
MYQRCQSALHSNKGQHTTSFINAGKETWL